MKFNHNLFNKYNLQIFFIDLEASKNYYKTYCENHREITGDNNMDGAQNNKKSKHVVELFNGFFWDCEECGYENFERALVPEFEQDLIEAVKAAHNIPDETEHIMFCSPREVTCKTCQTTYFTKVNHFE